VFPYCYLPSVSKNGYGQLMDRKFVGYGQSNCP
jgi:hypothetical protein